LEKYIGAIKAAEAFKLKIAFSRKWALRRCNIFPEANIRFKA